MSIPSDNVSSERLLKVARYHVAMTTADPAASTLGPPVKELADKLKSQQQARADAEDQVVMKSALLDRADYDLDQACRAVELDVLSAVSKDRSSTLYRALFPNGLSALVALRGAAQSREVEKMVASMRQRAPDLAAKYADKLLALGETMVDAEKALIQANGAQSQAFAEERLLRSELVRQLRRNEGALMTLYPGKRALVRSYFPSTRTTSGGEPEEPATQDGPGAELA